MQTATATDRATAVARAARHAALREPMALTVTCRGEAVTFESRLSDDAAQDLLQYAPGRFAQSLWQQSHDRGLSERQLAWAHKIACELIQQESDDDDSEPRFGRLFETFKAAKSRGLKRLTMRFAGIRIKPSKDLQSLWVLSDTETEEGHYGLQPKYLGKVTPRRMDSRLSDDVKSVILEAAQHPLAAAIRYGRETGRCSCCGRDLTNPDSIAAGIGPICREKYGL